uniref:Transposase for insertion sequence element IS21-like C-terminal domain-containing protein n=1 Tax=Candidatus Kentrum sp. LFY TaxID=2126342 RepID=A0A450V4R2_9GAMM|nr:MAG: hypothetical protein BECKLFY1418A_GA0070994_11039 [Candidatus Kentron sp. LFY]
MIASRNNRGRSHENGAIEASHSHLERRPREALVIRGSHDFESLAEYQGFIDVIAEGANHRNLAVIEAERATLAPLPADRMSGYGELFVRVSTSATIRVAGVLYSAPSRLIGERLRVHLHESRLSCHVGSRQVLSLPRVHSPEGKGEARCVDYRHLIGSLAEKPMAFRRARLRDDILPNEIWRVVWRILDDYLPARQACRLMVGALKLAAEHDCEEMLGRFLLQVTSAGRIPSLAELRRRFGPNDGLAVIPGEEAVGHLMATISSLNTHLRGERSWAT